MLSTLLFELLAATIGLYQPPLSIFPSSQNEVRYIYKHKKDNPENEVSLQADEDVLAMKEAIKYAGRKALTTFWSSIVSHENDKSRKAK